MPKSKKSKKSKSPKAIVILEKPIAPKNINQFWVNPLGVNKKVKSKSPKRNKKV